MGSGEEGRGGDGRRERESYLLLPLLKNGGERRKEAEILALVGTEEGGMGGACLLKGTSSTCLVM